MLFWVLRPVRFLLKALRTDDSPRQLAMGVALGLLIGLVPKGNLIALSLAAVLLATRVNLAAGAGSAFVFSWIGLLLDPLAHRIGNSFLSLAPLEGIFAFLYSLPLMPWTGFNNTVVMGNLLIGLWLFLPMYCVSEHAFERWTPRVRAWVKRRKIVQLLSGAEFMAQWRIS